MKKTCMLCRMICILLILLLAVPSQATSDGIDMSVIEAGVPQAIEPLNAIKANCDEIAVMLIDMGQRQSASNVPTIKSLSYETIEMIEAYAKDQIEFVDALLAE